MEGIEVVTTPPNNCHARFVPGCVEETTKVGDIMPVRLGDEGLMDGGLAEEGEGRSWNDHGAEKLERARNGVGWERGEKGRIRVHTNTHGQHLAGGENPIGGPYQKVEIDEIDIRPAGGKGSQNDLEDPEEWEAEISKAGAGRAFIYSDGSLHEGGNEGGGSFVVESDGGEGEVQCGIGNVATVWGGVGRSLAWRRA